MSWKKLEISVYSHAIKLTSAEGKDSTLFIYVYLYLYLYLGTAGIRPKLTD